MTIQLCMTWLAEQQVPVHTNGGIEPQRGHVSECCPKQLTILPGKAKNLSDHPKVRQTMAEMHADMYSHRGSILRNAAEVGRLSTY